MANKHRDSALTIRVLDNTEEGMNKAISVLRKKLQMSGAFKELRNKRYYEKPSERRKRKQKESDKRRRTLNSKMKRNR